MSRAEQYRRYAAECVRLASASESAREKAMLVQMAEQWRQLAKRAEQETVEP